MKVSAFHEVVFARHGETGWNRIGGRQGQLDSPLMRRPLRNIGWALPCAQLRTAPAPPGRRHLSSASTVVVVGHFPRLEAPEQVNTLISEFLDSHT